MGLNDFFEVIKSRRSVRRFDERKEVSQEQIQQILEAGHLSPSAHNLQDWFFVVVKDPKIKKKLVEAAAGQDFVGQASVVFVVCADLRLADKQSGRHGRDFYMIQDTAIATTSLWLAAVSLGLGACWVGAFDEEEVKKILGLEEYLRPVALLPVGYPAERPSPTFRKRIREISKEI